MDRGMMRVLPLEGPELSIGPPAQQTSPHLALPTLNSCTFPPGVSTPGATHLVHMVYNLQHSLAHGLSAPPHLELEI